ncbi:MAG TPA: EAL domain-containing protein, partial [Rhodocyclaceae bacterium]
YYKDEKGRYLGCNKAFEQFVGIERERLVGRTVYDIAPGQAADRYFAADQELLDKPGTQTYEASVTHADRSKREVVYYKATFNKADGSLGGIVGVMLDISDRKNMEDRVWREANYDALTGLPNRRLFRDRMREEIKRARRTGRGLALLFIDLDRFKEVNDTLGHDAGDQLLIDAAQRICTRVRATDTVSRPGGDEFIVILPDIAEATQVGRLAGEIIDALVQPFQINAQTAYVSASIGVALFPDDTDDMDTLLSYADQAMYAAKEQGRNCFSYFTPSMQEKARLRMQLANDLRQALPLGQLQVYLQPIVNLSSGLIVKAEALLRWRHPLLGMVPPDRFIPIAEEIGLINEIGDWVFREAAAAAKRWSDPWFIGGSQPVQVAVNKSPRQLVTGNTEKSWIEHLRQIGLPNGFIVIEITEGLLMDSRPEVAEKLLDFRDAGIEVSLDDFGTGYSAMSYLKKFDIDYLKIDKSFVRDMTSDPSDRAIVEAIIVMAHKLGMKVIAEGVETAEQRDLLEAAGCDFGQGYFFARPMPIPDFETFLVTANRGND